MSELISNDTMRSKQRKEALKEVIRSLHAGRSVDEVKGDFAALLRDVGGGEVAELEQALIDEGLPESEIKRLCDVHVAVFQDALDLQDKPQAGAAHPVEVLRAENAAVEGVLVALEEALDKSDWAGARSQLAALREYGKHYLRKENILFPYLERYGFSGPSAVMWAIHDDIRDAWKSLGGKLAEAQANGPDGLGDRIRDEASALVKAVRDMVYKEENILVPAALERLSEQDWDEVRAQEPEIGFFQVEPPAPERPSHFAAEGGAVKDTAAGRAAWTGVLLDTGALTPIQINLLLTHLPVDVTYVDEEDRVRYFSAGAHRVFPRSPAIIGREVQKCHPPASMGRVQEILDDFRGGVRDVAEFWIQMRGRFIHIRYYALRDDHGRYRGTLEVSQDVTGIRALEGEKRLLDETDGTQ